MSDAAPPELKLKVADAVDHLADELEDLLASPEALTKAKQDFAGG